MKQGLFIFLLSVCFCGWTQNQAPDFLNNSDFLPKLKDGAELIYYQCHVEEGVQQLSTVSGQTLTGNQQKYTITEKFVIKEKEGNYTADYYSSSMIIFPNRRFSGLKIRERPYWEFKFEKTIALNIQDLKVLVSLEKKGREAMEYDYPITKYTNNQIIIKSKKQFKQLVIDGNYVISKIISR